MVDRGQSIVTAWARCSIRRCSPPRTIPRRRGPSCR
jgi:hypothetical protein